MPVRKGIPVIDIANLIQTLLQVINDFTEIENQIVQIEQLRDQVNSITGSRNLGAVLNNPALQNYVPSNAFNVLNDVDVAGDAGLTATARALRSATMLYNCADPCRPRPHQLPGKPGAAVPTEGPAAGRHASRLRPDRADHRVDAPDQTPRAIRRPCSRSRHASAPRTRY